MKVALDTNVWISGVLLPNSQAGKIIKAWNKATLDIAISGPVLKEIEKVLSYPKINKRIGWSKKKIKHYIELLRFFCGCCRY